MLCDVTKRGEYASDAVFPDRRELRIVKNPVEQNRVTLNRRFFGRLVPTQPLLPFHEGSS